MSNKENSVMHARKSGAAMLPRLRFPEFKDSGDWTVVLLGKIAEVLSEKAGDRKLTLFSITSGVGLISQIEKFGREIAGAQYKNYYVIYPNDFAYNKSATKDFPEGFIAYHRGAEPGAVPNSIFTCFRVRPGASYPPLLNYQFASNLHGKWLRRFITVGARAHGSLNVDDKDLLATPVPVPPLATRLVEQRKIADCLSSLDELIAQEKQKLETLKAHKEGLMQKLFPREGEAVPQRRFPNYRNAPAWKWMPFLGVVSRSFYGTSSSTSGTGKYPVLRMGNMMDGGIDIANLAFIDMSDSEFKKFKLNEGDILLNRTNSAELVGKISRFSLSGDYVAASYIVAFRLKAELIDSGYCNYLLNSEHYQRKIRSLATRAISQANINPTSFQERFQIPIPSRPEQEAISDCFSALDESIIAQTRKFDALKRQKIGLTQRLFPTLTEVGE